MFLTKETILGDYSRPVSISGEEIKSDGILGTNGRRQTRVLRKLRFLFGMGCTNQKSAAEMTAHRKPHDVVIHRRNQSSITIPLSSGVFVSKLCRPRKRGMVLALSPF